MPYLRPDWGGPDEYLEHPDNIAAIRSTRIFLTKEQIYHWPHSEWSNPKLDMDGYESHIRDNLWDRLEELTGKRLGCYCLHAVNKLPPREECTCHTQILVHLYCEKFGIVPDTENKLEESDLKIGNCFELQVDNVTEHYLISGKSNKFLALICGTKKLRISPKKFLEGGNAKILRIERCRIH